MSNARRRCGQKKASQRYDHGGEEATGVAIVKLPPSRVGAGALQLGDRDKLPPRPISHSQHAVPCFAKVLDKALEGRSRESSGVRNSAEK